MEQIVVKIEDQNNGEILLYYVDENGEHQEGVLTTIENIENSSLPIQDSSSYILGDLADFVTEEPIENQAEETSSDWKSDEIKRLLLFFTDNKSSFVSGTTQKKHLWAVACKTMLVGKNQDVCQAKLDELKNKYIELRELFENGAEVHWPYFDLCHQAFHDDAAVKFSLNTVPEQNNVTIIKQEIIQPVMPAQTVKVTAKSPRTVDEKVMTMLNLYLKYKENFRKEYWRRDLWDKIAAEMGEKDGEYLQKRFFNYKQHYIKLITQKKETGSCPNWPYINLFKQIFDDDVNFHKKYLNTDISNQTAEEVKLETEWDISDHTILAKYVYDAFDEFEDPTIPDEFLWGEVGRLLEKAHDICQLEYNNLKENHLKNYSSDKYDLQKRIPLHIILDCILAKEVKKQLSNDNTHELETPLTLEETDELVKYIFDYSELFKDSTCHFICFKIIGSMLGKPVGVCKAKWEELLQLYQSILAEKKNNSDLQIDWRYIDLFDRMFHYGMDIKLFEGFYDMNNQSTVTTPIAVKKITIEDPEESNDSQNDPLSLNNTEPRTDPRSTLILEYYLKNKEKFNYHRNKLPIWEPLAKEINITATQCSHRLKFLKKCYIEHIQKEMNQPRCKITWPYYSLCKKVFGYRTIKNKLKYGQMDSDSEEWLEKEIKKLITYFIKNFNDISNNIEDLSKWAPLANELGRTVKNCKEKFIELRKCYRKLKTMKKRNPGVKISWCYFDTFDKIYSMQDGEDNMEVEMLEEQWEVEGVENGPGAEDEYECIIVLPEGQELTDLSNAQIVIEKPETLQNITLLETSTEPQQKQAVKWTKRNKKRLLICYINYIRLHRNKEITNKVMWKEIAKKLSNKTADDCKKMFTKMLNSYKVATDVTKQNSPFTNLLEKVLKLKPNFVKMSQKLKDGKDFKDVVMDTEKVVAALKYYLEHIDDFANPKFEKQYLWNQLAKTVNEPVTKVYNKINYLKQKFNISEETNGENDYNHLLKEIIIKEVALNEFSDTNTHKQFDYIENWTEDETEILLNWYLSNLDKFKNPKFTRSYLWMEASSILSKDPVVCSKKMTEIRTQYRNMVKQNSEELNDWRFLDLCQKIYGTGKRGSSFENH